MINKEELKNIYGGGFGATYIAALVRGINTIMDVGRSIGTVIRRITTGRMC